MAKKKEISIEEGFENLQNILTKMENRDVTLEESFNLYNEGVVLVKELNEKLADVEGKLNIINE